MLANTGRLRRARPGDHTLTFAILIGPLAVEAQQAGKVARVVILSPGEKPPRFFEVFQRALRELGWVQGENVKLELRLAGEDYARLRAVADEVVRN